MTIECDKGRYHTLNEALVMPYAAMSRQAYAPFRKGKVAQLGQVAFRLRFTASWIFGPEVQPLFPVPSCVLFANVHDDPLVAPLPAQVAVFSGTLPRRDADESEADVNLTEEEAFWPMDASEQQGSPYRRAFRQGAILVPRRLVLVEAVPVMGMLPPNPVSPLVRGRMGRQDKKPWNTVEAPQGMVEKDFLRPAVLGESIAPFRIMAPLLAIIPWDAERRGLLDARMAAALGYRSGLKEPRRCGMRMAGAEDLFWSNMTISANFRNSFPLRQSVSCTQRPVPTSRRRRSGTRRRSLITSSIGQRR